MCTKLLDWFNNEFLFMFESKKFKTNNSDKLHHNIKIIIDEPKISPSNESTVSTLSTLSTLSTVSTESTESTESTPLKDDYDLYTWDIL
jgi:hypothetical protein